MGGQSRANQPQITSAFLPIKIEEDIYNIWIYPPKKRSATDKELLKFTDKVLKIFWTIEKSIIKSNSLDLSPEFCQETLSKLAYIGLATYNRFFEDSESKQQLMTSFQFAGEAPTFLSGTTSFPWEVLYQGDDYKNPDPDLFWGFRYTPARLLTLENLKPDLAFQAGSPDLLFCLHHKLLQAHQHEWPEIRQLIMITYSGHCCMLSCALNQVTDGETLLEYLNHADHNILHFACHCQPSLDEIDDLLISLMQEDRDGEPKIIKLGTMSFLVIKGELNNHPLIFLNACQSAGGDNDLRKTFNLPDMFIKRGAAAVIATVCPVPDLFAAAFANCFYSFFLSGEMTIGQALRSSRLYFLEKYNNPLGLAYGLYSPAYYRRSQSPALGGDP